ncbi:MAG: hypothetical protein JWQ11_263, partial [Rhizobacter sp.]|nr:hypothetical protein [Rhizobacter sp.]
MNSRTPFCKPSLAAMIVSATLSLAACGGDDSEIYEVSENTNADSSPTGANTGKIVAPFVVGATSRGMLAGLGTFSSSNLAEGHRLVQAADGAITTIGAYSLADSVTVNEISGDATFALGRWSRGRMVGGSRDMLLDGQDARSYHYL